MVLTQRERHIVTATIVTLSLLGVYQFVVTPYFDHRKTIAEERKKLDDEKETASHLFSRQDRLRKVWTEIQKGGLKTDPSEADSQVYNALLNWAATAGVDVPALKPDRSMQEGKFQINSYHVMLSGPLRAMSRMLWAVETANIPVRVNEIQIRPQKEGTDDLSVQLSVSTLCLLPDSVKSGKTAVSSADSRGARP